MSFELKQSLIKLIRNSNCTVNDIKQLLDPTSTVLSTNSVSSNMLKIVDVLTKDRNNDCKFTIDDLKYLSEDVLGITNLISSVILILHDIPNFSSTYSRQQIEDLVFRCIAYILLVLVPAHTKVDWSIEDKEALLDLLITLYNVMQSLQITNKLIVAIANLFKSRRLKCCCGDDAEIKEEIIEKNLAVYNTNLRFNVFNSKDKIKMNNAINTLHKKQSKSRSKKSSKKRSSK